jgi:hypothetical protein
LSVTSMMCSRGRPMFNVAKDMEGTSVWHAYDERSRIRGQLIGRRGGRAKPRRPAERVAGPKAPS